MNYYAHEKVRQLNNELATLDKNALHAKELKSRRWAVFVGVVSLVGRGMRRAGEGLESWALAAPPDSAPSRLRQ